MDGGRNLMGFSDCWYMRDSKRVDGKIYTKWYSKQDIGGWRHQLCVALWFSRSSQFNSDTCACVCQIVRNTGVIQSPHKGPTVACDRHRSTQRSSFVPFDTFQSPQTHTLLIHSAADRLTQTLTCATTCWWRDFRAVTLLLRDSS